MPNHSLSQVEFDNGIANYTIDIMSNGSVEFQNDSDFIIRSIRKGGIADAIDFILENLS